MECHDRGGSGTKDGLTRRSLIVRASAGAIPAPRVAPVPAVLRPAFGFAGQKCPAASRLRAPA